MIQHAPIANIFVDSPDYFAATQTDGGVRFGLKGVSVYFLKPGHAAQDRLLACKSSDDVEAVFDDFQSNVYGQFHYVGA